MKLALAVERRLRRPAAQLRALLAAADRRTGGDTPLATLVAGPDPLALLAALMAAPAPETAVGRQPGRGMRLAPAVTPEAGGDRRRVAQSEPPPPKPAWRTDGGVALRRTSDPAVEPGKGAAALDRAVHAQSPARARAAPAVIAAGRETLRRALAGTPAGAGAEPHARRPDEPLLPDLKQHGDPEHDRPAATHALIAAACLWGTARVAGGEAEPEAAAPARRSAMKPTGILTDLRPLRMAEAPPGGQKPDAGSMPAPAEGPPVRAAVPSAAGQVQAPADPRRRGRPPLALLDDAAEALAEAAWRNGMDAPWP